MTAWYRQGTVSATNGQTTVTGSLTAFLMNVKVGDLWAPDADARAYEVTAVNDNTEIEIFPAYAGSSGSGKAYGIARISPNWNSVSEIGVSLAEIFATARDIRTSTGVPDNALGVDGDVCFRLDEPEYYRKESGVWVLVTELTGPQGPGGPSYQATSTSSVAIGTGNKTFTVESGRGYGVGQWLRASHDGSNYMEGTVTSYSSTTLVINVPSGRNIGSGTYTSWNINIAGDVGPANSLVVGSVTTGTAGSNASVQITGTAPSQTINFTIPRGNTGATGAQGPQGDTGPTGSTGATGATGASYAGTSTTSNTIGTGTKTFTTQAALAYVVGSRVRFASISGPNNWMEGPCTAYSGTSISASIDKTGGSGTLTDWSLSLAGQPGVDGLGAGTVNAAINGIELVSGGSTAQLTDTGVTPGAYSLPVVTVDAKGRITDIASSTIEDPVAMAIVFGA